MGKILWKMGDFGYILISRIISKKWKNDEFHNIAPQIFVNVYGHWFHCVALCELIWMHCVVLFILDLLERYRQNVAEHTTTCSLLQALIKRGPVEVGCWKLCAKFYHRVSLVSYSEFLHLFKVVLCPPNSHTHTLKDYTLSLHGTQVPPSPQPHSPRYMRFSEKILGKYCPKLALMLITKIWIPPPCHPENCNWYHCLVLCKLFEMHWVEFFILPLLKRYRRNTAENRHSAKFRIERFY